MGARVNFVFKQDDSGYDVTLYSHWGDNTWADDLAYALSKAEPRWSDPTYATRIVVSQLIGDDWNKETGYGLFVSDGNITYLDHPVIVNFIDNTVDGQSFKSFIEEYGR